MSQDSCFIIFITFFPLVCHFPEKLWPWLYQFNQASFIYSKCVRVHKRREEGKSPEKFLLKQCLYWLLLESCKQFKDGDKERNREKKLCLILKSQGVSLTSVDMGNRSWLLSGLSFSINFTSYFLSEACLGFPPLLSCSLILAYFEFSRSLFWTNLKHFSKLSHGLSLRIDYTKTVFNP